MDGRDLPARESENGNGGGIFIDKTSLIQNMGVDNFMIDSNSAGSIKKINILMNG